MGASLFLIASGSWDEQFVGSWTPAVTSYLDTGPYHEAIQSWTKSSKAQMQIIFVS